ncbi:MAG TPA: tripartite tricarboxylate transporter substrate binding protein [Azospirillum sp.]|nr:tripartite tricarboxylate transporter substrate binding protein [Azospirillum sp.]
MLTINRRTFAAGGLAAAMACALCGPTSAASLKSLEIIAPASPGGGWDQTARAIQEVLRSAGIVPRVQVVNISGAGGTIGLAQFVSSKKGHDDTLMVTGLIMEGAILTNKSPVSLENTTPIARLIGEYDLIVVPTDSPIKSMADLVDKLRADPSSVSWGGGSAGGMDHILVGLIAKAVGVDPKKINYIAHSGGGEAMGSILGGHVTAGINGYSELIGQIQAGKIRPLAISAEKRIAGIDVPTLKETGIDVTLTNWRGIVAPPGIRDSERKAFSDAIAALVASEQWKQTLAQREWIDMYQPADEFAAFLRQDRVKVEGILKEIGLVQ